jgi:hypothetical protein
MGCSSLLLDFLYQGMVEYFPGKTGNVKMEKNRVEMAKKGRWHQPLRAGA